MEQPGPLPNTHGLLRVFAGTDQAAATEIGETPSANTRWRILAIRFQLVTDATAATRQVILRLSATSNIWDIPSLVTQAASLTRDYNFIAGGPDRAAAVGQNINVQLPLDLWINDAFTISTITTNMQAGDNYGAPIFFVEEWIEE